MNRTVWKLLNNGNTVTISAATFAARPLTMATTTITATIGRKVGPDGAITLYVKDHPWGPIVTGKNLDEAKAKFRLALTGNMIANSYCETRIRKEKDDNSAQADSEERKALEDLKNERLKLEEELNELQEC